MSQCLRITFSVHEAKDFLHKVIQKKARSLEIEGTAQVANGDGKMVRLFACGSKDAVEDFLDILHKEAALGTLKDLAVEPFIKERDFRGVFRIIE
jgi:acylphosphatase